MRNPYETLGVAATAPADEIRSAYRKLAKRLHPDLNPGDATAEEKFKEVGAAWALLKDEATRRRFDAGEIDASGAERPPPRQEPYYRDYAADHERSYTAAGGYDDFADGDDSFAELLRRSAQARANRRGSDLHFRLAVPFADAIRGAATRVALPDGSTLDVAVPPGLVDGQVLRLRGKGAPGAGSGGPGDALVAVEVLPDPRFTREGDDIVLDLPVSLAEAVLGGPVRVPTATGAVTMTVPKGSNTGSTLRLRGKGAPRRGGGAGDQLVRLRIVLPRTPDPELEAFVAGWSAGRSFDPREEDAR